MMGDNSSISSGRLAIDAYAELHQLGQFGERGLRLLFTLMKEETQRFPVLRPASGWDEDSIWECVQEFFADKGAKVTAALLAQATDAASMGRYLRKSLRYWLVSKARETDVGAIRRKVEDLLAARSEFAKVPDGKPGAGRWTLAGGPTTPYAGELRPLVQVAYAVPGVQAVAWTGKRRAPLASDEALVDILTAVLDAACGSLEVAQLTHVFVQRFPAAVDLADASIDETTFNQVTDFAEDRPDNALAISETAHEVYEQLSPSQRALLPHLHEKVEDQMQVLEIGRSQTYQAVSKLKATLAELIPNDSLRDEITLEVNRLCCVNP